MKKRCTPTNNAINICCPVECPEPVIPPVVEGCVDALTYTFNLAISSSLVAEASVVEQFDRILDKGIIMPKDDSICCPPCNNFYALASMETTLKLYEVLGWLDMQTPRITPCCYNMQASIETGLKFEEYDIDLECCDTNIAQCLKDLSNLIDIDRLLDKGVIETHYLGDTSALCILKDLIESIKEPYYISGSITEVFDRILDKGFVVFCCGCNIIISSVETFLKWVEANLDSECFNQ